MTLRRLFAVLATLSALLPAFPSAADEAGGPNSAYKDEVVVFPGGIYETRPVLTTQIPRGKAGTVLVITISVQDQWGGYKKQGFEFFPVVNGVPRGDQAVVARDRIYFGSGSGTWFVDMDTSGFVGQPLTISVYGLTYPSYKDNLSRTVKVNLAAVMQPK
jgi:hypothetical protein